MSKISFSVNNFDYFLPKTNNISIDRFIPTLNSMSSLPKSTENSFFGNILQKNLCIQNQTSNNPNSPPIKMPKQKKIQKRYISKNPFKVLDAPFLQDDYYLNVVDWCKNNTLAVGLANCIYTWNYQSNSVQKLI